MQTYEAYKETGIEWIGKIPKHWKIERVKDIVQLRTEKTSEKSEEKNYLELENIEQGTGRIIDFKDTIEVSSDITIFRKGDVLFGKLRPYLAKYWLADRDGKCTGEIIAFNCFKIESSFFKYFIGSPKFIELCTAVAYGAKMPRVDWTRQIAYFYIAFPTPTEQTAIAQYLDQATKQIDKAIAIKTKQLEKLETYKKSKIHETVTKGTKPNPKLKPSNISWIGEIPEHWKVERLKFVLTKIGSGVTPKGGSTVYQETGIPFIRSQNVYNDGFYFDEIAFISEKIHEEMKGSKVLFGDVLLNITGASIGRCFPYLSTEEANVNQHVCILRPNEKIITEFLHYLMISEIGQNQITSGFKGSGREGLNFETIKNFAITLPKKNEQKAIATYLDNFCKNIENAKENIEKQLTQLKKYRKSLIHECVTGKRKIA